MKPVAFNPQGISIQYDEQKYTNAIEQNIKKIINSRSARGETARIQVINDPVQSQRNYILELVMEYVNSQQVPINSHTCHSAPPTKLVELPVVHRDHEELFLKRVDKNVPPCSNGTQCEAYIMCCMFQVEPYLLPAFCIGEQKFQKCILCIRCETLSQYFISMNGQFHRPCDIIQPWTNVSHEYTPEFLFVDPDGVGIVAPFVYHQRHRYQIHPTHFEQLDFRMGPRVHSRGIIKSPYNIPRLYHEFIKVDSGAVNPYANNLIVCGEPNNVSNHLEMGNQHLADELLFTMKDDLGRRVYLMWTDLPDIVPHLRDIVFDRIDHADKVSLIALFHTCVGPRKNYKTFVTFIYDAMKKEGIILTFIRFIMYSTLCGLLPSARCISSPGLRVALGDHLIINPNLTGEMILQEKMSIYMGVRELFCFLVHFDTGLMKYLNRCSNYKQFEQSVYEAADTNRRLLNTGSNSERRAYFSKNASFKQYNLEILRTFRDLPTQIVSKWPATMDQPHLSLIRYMGDDFFTSLHNAGLDYEIIQQLMERDTVIDSWLLMLSDQHRRIVLSMSFLFYCRDMLNQQCTIMNYANKQARTAMRSYDQTKYDPKFTEAYVCLPCRSIKTFVQQPQEKQRRKVRKRSTEHMKDAIGDTDVQYDVQHRIISCAPPKKQRKKSRITVRDFKRVDLSCVLGTSCDEKKLDCINFIGYRTMFFNHVYFLCTQCGVVCVYDPSQVSSDAQGEPDILCRSCHFDRHAPAEPEKYRCLLCNQTVTSEGHELLTVYDGHLLYTALCKRHSRNYFDKTRIQYSNQIIAMISMARELDGPTPKRIKR